MKRTALLCALLITAMSSPLFAQDTRTDFSGPATATFSDQYWTGKTCSYTANAEVKVIHDPQYMRAFTYTLHNLTPVLDDCFHPYADDFTAFCRAWVTSTGTANIDVVGIGVITVTPKDLSIRQALAGGAVNANAGFGAEMLKYRLTRLPDGSIEIFAYRLIP